VALSKEKTMPETPDQTPVTTQDRLQDVDTPQVQSGLLDFPDPVGAADNKQFTPEMAEVLRREAEQKAHVELLAKQSAEQAKQPEETRTARQIAEDAHSVANRAAVEQFQQRVLDARKSEAVAPRLQPVSPLIYDRTRAEMSAGAKMNEHHANLKFNAPKRRVIDPREGTSTEVMRSASSQEYAGTFKSVAQTPSKDNVTQPRR
jgi:hypothetical protein